MTEQNLQATQAEDLDAIAKTLHPDSPHYQSSLELQNRLNDTYDLRYRLLNFRFVAFDGEHAYARVEQETRKYAGPDFQDNVLDSIWVYRLDGGQWKIWSVAILTIEASRR